MNKSIIKQVDKAIKTYFEDEKRIKNMQWEIESLKILKTKLENDIKTTNITLDYTIQGINYEKEKVQNYGIITSLQDKTLENEIEKLEKKIQNIDCRIVELNNMIYDLEIKNTNIKSILNRLDRESEKLINYIYENRKTSLEVAFNLNFADSTVRMRKQKILEDLARWFYWHGM